MPVLIFLNGTKHLLEDLMPHLSYFDLEIHRDDFVSTRSLLSNTSVKKLYILFNCDLKPHRYEIYCLAKKQEMGYCVLSSCDLSTAKHDNPHIIAHKYTTELLANEIICALNTKLQATTAHKKKLVCDNNYLCNVKRSINKINDEYKNVLQVVKKNAEMKLLNMLRINTIDIRGLESLYKNMLEKEI